MQRDKGIDLFYIESRLMSLFSECYFLFIYHPHLIDTRRKQHRIKSSATMPCLPHPLPQTSSTARSLPALITLCSNASHHRPEP